MKNYRLKLKIKKTFPSNFGQSLIEILIALGLAALLLPALLTGLIASREGKAIAARNEIYLANLPAYELERLRLLKDILGDKAVLYFVPQGTDLTLLLSGAGGPNVVPLPQTVTVEPTDAPTPEPTVTP